MAVVVFAGGSSWEKTLTDLASLAGLQAEAVQFNGPGIVSDLARLAAMPFKRA
jgi:hypothetical protein